MTEESVYVGLGANLGDPRQVLAAAYADLQRLPATHGHRCSPWFRTAPVDSSGPDYVNAVATFTTSLAPHDLLRALQRIEDAYGRERPYRNAPRTLDLDLLIYGQHVLDSDTLTVPHPRLHLRAFVLRPLAALSEDLVVPGHGSVRSLLPTVAEQDAQPIG